MMMLTLMQEEATYASETFPGVQKSILLAKAPFREQFMGEVSCRSVSIEHVRAQGQSPRGKEVASDDSQGWGGLVETTMRVSVFS